MQEAPLLSARGTVAEHLDRVVDAGEPVLGGHPRGPLDGFACSSTVVPSDRHTR